MTIHRVYWTEDDEPKSKSFGKDSIDQMLKYCEQLRKDRVAGRNVSFIGTATENPDCMSLPGVAAPAADYDWEKRRGGGRK